MNTYVVELIPRPGSAADDGAVLTLEREDPDEWSELEPNFWVKLHVGIVLRKSSSRVPPTAKHREDWTWLDFGLAGEAMEQLRKPGTSVLVLSTWTELRRKGRQVVLRPTRCEALRNLRWTAKFSRKAAEMAHVARSPGEEAVSKLLPRNRTKWRYEGRDRRAWESVKLRLVNAEDQNWQPPARTPREGQLRLF